MGGGERQRRRTGAALAALSGHQAEVATSGESLRQIAAETTETSGQAVEELLHRLSGEIERSGASLRDTVTRSAEARPVGALIADRRPRCAGRIFAGDRHLRTASSAVDQSVAGAGERLTAVQGGLAARVEEFQRALGGISAQVATLGRLASSTQADAVALAAAASPSMPMRLAWSAFRPCAPARRRFHACASSAA